MKGAGLKSIRKQVRSKTNYVEAGYDPADGLEGGRWMWDDRRAIRVWVVVDKPPAPEVVFTRTCHDCGTTVGKRFRYCESCGRERDRAVKRSYMRAKRTSQQGAVA